MKKNVLIIEDNQTDYEIISKILVKHEINVLPADIDEFKKFAKVLRDFGNTKTEILLQQIKQYIGKNNFDFVILDRSFTNKFNDNSGEIIEERILKPLYPDIGFCYLSNFPNELNKPNYLEKGDDMDWEVILYSSVISKIKTELIQDECYNKDELHTKDEKQEQLLRKPMDDLFKRTKFISLEKLAEIERYKILPLVSFLIDMSIKYIFYLCLTLYFIYAPIYLILSTLKDGNPIIVAENTFIVFLPFLIICSFYVFYIKSLSPYIRQKPIDNDTFEASSTLMNLTKKLFVSSLISFLFVKFIEYLIIERGTDGPSNFALVYNVESRLSVLYFLLAFIVLLIGYFLLIGKHPKQNRMKRPVS